MLEKISGGEEVTIEQIPWLAEGLIAEGQTHLVLARPGRGKSWLVDQLAVSVARGNDFLGQFPVKQGSLVG